MITPFHATRPTLEEVARQLAVGEITALALTEQALAAIDAREPIVRAWVTIDRDGALAAAAAADSDRANGEPRGLLDGIPFGIKDIIDVAGLPTSGGSVVPVVARAERDAPIIALLRDAGAIILGKTVSTPYAWIDPPPTTNPWNEHRTPGGSSSGSAAALAAGMCLGALGSQTGGSLMRPAAFCGVASLKPTFDALSVDGVLPLAPSLDHPGPMARCAGDLARIWRALKPSIAPTQASESPPRIGDLAQAFRQYADEDARAALAAFTVQIQHAGAEIRACDVPEAFANIHAEHRLIMAAEAAKYHLPRFARHPNLYPPRITELIREGELIPDDSYKSACERQSELKRSFPKVFERCDALLTPAARGAAPDCSTTGDPIMNSPWSYLGLPTVCIPIARNAEGMPLAIQLVGPPNHEARLLEIAVWCEKHAQKAMP